MIAGIGSIFLWMYWPSFNGALVSGVEQERVIVNTVLGITGSCMSAACVARYLFGKLEMEIMLNATLAGGVAVGSSANLFDHPWQAMMVGFIAGALSSAGFQRIGPFLSENINLQDTCGVNSLHGMPGIFGAVVSAIVIAGIENKGFPVNSAIFTDGVTFSEQAGNQLASLAITLAISIFSGISGGFIAGLSIFQPVHSLFRDDDHFWEIIGYYPAEYLVGGDEVYDEAKASFEQIKDLMKMKRLSVQGNKEEAIDTMVDDIWNQNCQDEKNMTRTECKKFLVDFIHQADHRVQVSESALEEIFKSLDIN